MERWASRELRCWLDDDGRRPLILRGARQVGKTWLVRELAAQAGRELIELNFERDPGHRRAFASNDPVEIIGELSLMSNRDIQPDRCILFLDEIQAAGDLLAKLRWFYEEMPALPVIAAGSLLEFTLAAHEFSMPVGRVAFRTLQPMGFPEFLAAHGQDRLLAALDAWRPGQELSATAHERATAWFHRYAMVGGLPAVVAADAAGRSPRECREIQRDLVAAYRSDFAKYSGRMDQAVLDVVLRVAVASLGRKFVYAQAGDGVKAHQAKRALELLLRAELCHVVRHTAANGLPLSAEVKDTLRKVVLLDVGLAHAVLGTPAAAAFPTWDSLAPAVRGQLTEQLAGQQLRLVAEPGELFYWQREGGRAGEIDYIVQAGARIIPVELKAGATGAMKSLHQFMFDKGLDLAVRSGSNPPSEIVVAVLTTRGDPVRYTLVQVPGYLLWNLAAIIGERAG